MTAIGGRLAKVMYGSVVVAGLGTWELTGFTADLQEATAFGDTVKTYLRAGIDDAGSFRFDGNYDPDDTYGQAAINGLKTVTTGLTNLYFYETTSVFWRVTSGGTLLLSKFNAITMSKNALGQISFEGQVSAQAMERVT